MPEIRYGNMDGTCQLCYKRRDKFGTLVDPNGHLWLICVKCINSLWRKRQAKRRDSILNGKG